MNAENKTAPAPWRLTGEGYVVAVWMPMSATKIKMPWLRGRIQLLIFANYAQSNVGAYYELLHIPHLNHGVIKGYPSIDKIYVSTMASVINGQQNWGIPKELARFDYHNADGQPNTDLIEVKTPDDQAIARIEFESGGIKFPISTALAPKRLRTLVQDWQTKRFYVAPEAKGQACFAKVKNWTFNADYFPDLSQAKVISAIKISELEMIFPIPQISEISKSTE